MSTPQILHIRTPRGDHYTVNARGQIVTINRATGRAAFAPSNGWRLLGIRHVKRAEYIPFAALTPEKIASLTLKYKNGYPQYTARDLDHGTTREWGNTHYGGISDMYFEDATK